MALLRVFLFVLLFYLIIRFLGRLLFGFSAAQRASAGNANSHDKMRGKEGDVNIKYKPDNEEKIIRENDGEYVKFEDVDDD